MSRHSHRDNSVQRMLNDTVCPTCNRINIIQTLNDWGHSMPILCVDCDTLYWCRVFDDVEEITTEKYYLIEDQIPELPEGTEVILVKREHSYNLRPAIIIGRSHKHYRLEFRDGMVIWFPDNLVVKIPGQL